MTLIRPPAPKPETHLKKALDVPALKLAQQKREEEEAKRHVCGSPLALAGRGQKGLNTCWVWTGGKRRTAKQLPNRGRSWPKDAEKNSRRKRMFG
jgi:hypothetical protein